MNNSDGVIVSSSASGCSIPDHIIYGRSPAMQLVRRTMDRVAGTDVLVLILGESGTGKEVIAKEIHRRSPWHQGPFVKVSCPAVPGTLLESELFGYEKGAFTGAWRSKPGRVELANKGTFFLDEIAEMDLSLQSKLLQLLQDGHFSRLGGQGDTQIDARIICATNRNLKKELAAGTFRQDLFYRINVVSIHLPPLRERREDIPGLANYFLDSFNSRFNRRVSPFSEEFMQLLREYDWPGNIRELENCVKRYVIMDSESDISNELLAKRPSWSPLQTHEDGSLSLKAISRRAVQELERELILKVLQENRWNRKKVARILQISYRALLYKIKNAGLPSKRKRAQSPLPIAAESSGSD